jgi:hypothetical protein
MPNTLTATKPTERTPSRAQTSTTKTTTSLQSEDAEPQYLTGARCVLVCIIASENVHVRNFFRRVDGAGTIAAPTTGDARAKRPWVRLRDPLTGLLSGCASS